MADVLDVLTAYKAILATIDPSPQPAPTAVYVWPTDYDSMTYDYPVVIVAQTINEEMSYFDVHHGVGGHVWKADLLFLLAGQALNLSEMKAAEEMELAYQPAIVTTLFANRSVGGTAVGIGANRAVLNYRVGHIEWDSVVHWGIRVQVPILQHQNLPSS